MPPEIDPNTFRLRIEAKINVIAKALSWILGIVTASAAYFLAHTYEQNLQLGLAFLAACGAGALVVWLVLDRAGGGASVLSGVAIKNPAPCGSETTAKRMTPGTVMGPLCNVPPSV